MKELLPVNTIIRFPEGTCYRICGEPIGRGGCGILYPVLREPRNGDTESLPIRYALKECFPAAGERFSFTRSPDGEVIPKTPSDAAEAFLRRYQQMQLEEGRISAEIYKSGFRLIPVIEQASGVEYTDETGAFHAVNNTVTIMESQDQKGSALRSFLRQQRRFPLGLALRVTEQLLFALKEIHDAGFLHMDLQDGNVFVRGSFSAQNDLVSVLDFGASRRLLEDGKTAPIADCALTISEGFTAPEILEQNDGTLRVGREADLFSVGCLLRYMLTGILDDSYIDDPEAVVDVISRTAMDRAECPRHLQNRLRSLLGKAVQYDPSMRYHSCEEMLSDVQGLIMAVLPQRAQISDQQYDAFICYRHGEADDMAAELLQQKLEHFRIPGKSNGKKRIQNVFLDKGELASCSDYGAEIRSALEQSEWLIVICSAETKNSPWVEDEIRTFLRCHGEDRILAVLLEGEPEDVYPKGLDPQKVLAADARGADLRAVRKHLKTDALRKIAAPILNTTYDALSQRRKKYVLQRVLAAAAAAVAALSGFSVYAMRQASMLQKEYESTLRNESRYLITAAKQSIDQQDMFSAISALLRALPNQEQPRPFLPEGQDLLTQALALYTTPQEQLRTAVLLGRFQPEKDTSLNPDYFLDEAGETLYASTMDGTIYFVDTATMESRKTISVGSQVYAFHSRLLDEENGRVFAAGIHDVLCLSSTDGEQIWKTEVEGSVRELELCENQNELVVLTSEAIVVLDADDGMILKSISLDLSGEKVDDGYKWSMNKGPMRVSPDSAYAIFSISCSKEEGLMDEQDFRTNLVVTNLASGESDVILTGCYGIYDLEYANGRFLASGFSGLVYSYVSHNSLQEDYWNGQALVMSISPEDASAVWEYRFSCCSTNDVSMKLAAFQKEQDEPDTVLCAASNRCVALDLEDGEVLYSVDAPAPVIRLFQYDENSAGRFAAALQNGNMLFLDRKDASASTITRYPDDIADVLINGLYGYVRQYNLSTNESYILRYQNGGYDESWTEYDQKIDGMELKEEAFGKDCAALYSQGDENLLILLTGPYPDAVCRVSLPGKPDEATYSLMGISDSGEVLLHRTPTDYLSNDRGTVYAVSGDGEIREIMDLNLALNKDARAVSLTCCGDQILVGYTRSVFETPEAGHEEVSLDRIDTKTGEIQTLIQQSISESARDFVVFCDAEIDVGMLVLDLSDGDQPKFQAIMFDLSGKQKPFPATNWIEMPKAVVWKNQKQVLVCAPDALRIYRAGALVAEIPAEDDEYVSAALCPDRTHFVAVTLAGKVQLIRKDGELVNSTDIGERFDDYDGFGRIDSTHMYLITRNRMILLHTDPDAFGKVGEINSGFGFVEAWSSFVVRPTMWYDSLGCFPYLALDEIQTRAQSRIHIES